MAYTLNQTMSFYCIIKKHQLALLPWYNWMCGVNLKRTGICFGWLWFKIEINHYNRNKHLQSIINEYRNYNHKGHDALLQNDNRRENL